jgi:hypothetical protein
VRQDVPATATVMRARHLRPEGVVLAEGVHPFYSDLDTYAMAVACVDEAVRRVLCAGARYDRLSALDNFCWPDPVHSAATPDGEHKLAQLVRCCEGLRAACEAFGVPLISGKDSMKNDAVLGGVKISIPPTLLVSAMGQIDDVGQALDLTPVAAGDLVFVLGETGRHLGGSEFERMAGLRCEGVPFAEPERCARRYQAFAAVRDAGLGPLGARGRARRAGGRAGPHDAGGRARGRGRRRTCPAGHGRNDSRRGAGQRDDRADRADVRAGAFARNDARARGPRAAADRADRAGARRRLAAGPLRRARAVRAPVGRAAGGVSGGTIVTHDFSQFPRIDRAAAADLRVLVLTGYGLNCEAETAAGFRWLGAQVDLRHVADVLDGGDEVLRPYGLIAFIGGFSFGDHVGSGRVLANRLRHRLGGPAAAVRRRRRAVPRHLQRLSDADQDRAAARRRRR